MKRCFLLILIFYPCLLFAKIPLQQTSCNPIVSIVEDENNVCLDSAVTFRATIVNDGTNGIFKWKRNNADVGVNNAVFTASGFREGDVVVCEYNCTTTCGTTVMVISNTITMHVINDITPIIKVANQDSIICEGELTYFTTEAFYGSGVPSYEWRINNVPVGDTTPNYITDSLTNGSKVECILTVTTPGCPGAPKSSASWMTIYVYPMIHPAITITPSKTDICRGEQVTFTAKANGGAYPSFAWEINGIPTGDTSSALVINSLKDGDMISCTVTIDQDSRCHTSTSAPSNKVVMHVKDYVDPALSIDAPLLDACMGTSLTFTAAPKNTGDYTFYQWMVNDHGTGDNKPVFITSQLKNGDKISCILSTNIPGCSFTASVPSNYKIVTIKDTPVITFSPPAISVLSGEVAKLNASVTGGIASVLWTPSDILLSPTALSSATLPLAKNTLFNLAVTGINNCTANNSLEVKVLYKMHLPSAFTPNKDGKNDVFRIPPGSSVVLEKFSIFDRWGNVVFSTTDASKGWDGTYKNIKLPTGIYVYVVKGKLQNNPFIEKGTVTLIK